MTKLPIHEILEDLKKTLLCQNTLILQAPPGAGKSTVVPLALLDQPWLKEKMIIMLEPRRVAARMVASQMAKQLGEPVGQQVGYQVKMDRCYTQKTKILVVTEAVLVRMLQSNQSLDHVAMIIFDEFHERSIHTDLSLALSLQVQELLRDDLKLLIMSATLDAKELTKLLGDVPTITSKGRVFDVEHIYLDIKSKPTEYKSLHHLLLSTVLLALKENEGDILVFLAGVKEIKALQALLLKASIDKDILVCPLYSTLSKKEQDQAISKSVQRKIILSTNIAQTSLTIEGVTVVVDSGWEKQSRYNSSDAMDHLEVTFISKDAATQRAGRAGRLSKGRCYKLWHETKILQASSKPEILRADLNALVLDLALWGVTSFDELKWLDIPPENVLLHTRELLQGISMLDENFHITRFGKDALSLGLHPRFAYMILKAYDLGFAYEASLLAALLSEGDIFSPQSRDSDIRPRFEHLFEHDIDHPSINTYRAKEVLVQADLFYKKLISIKSKPVKNKTLKADILPVLLLLAYPDRLAVQRNKDSEHYKLSNAKGTLLHIEDSLYNQKFLVVAKLFSQNNSSFIKLALDISLEDIQRYFPLLIITKESISYNKEAKKFDIRRSRNFLKVQLDSQAVALSHKHDIKALLLDLIKTEGLSLLTWSKKALQLKDRVNFLHHHHSFHDFSDLTLLANIDTWLSPFLSNISTIKGLEALDLYPMLLNLLSWQEQTLLDTQAPTHISVPSGSNISIDYSHLDKPFISVKIQEMFGLHETPKILNQTLALQIHLLNPGMKPIQITYDLKSFWENSYGEVRKEMRGKYKRHYWPEDPFEAIATSKTKKHMMKE